MHIYTAAYAKQISFYYVHTRICSEIRQNAPLNGITHGDINPEVDENCI